MKRKNDQGFSLVEVLVAIVILAAFTVPTCSALVLSARMNEKTQTLMQAQLAVSSALEDLSAKGIKVTGGELKTVVGLDGGIEWSSETQEAQEALKAADPVFAALLESRKADTVHKSTDNDAFSVEVYWVLKDADGYYEVTAISMDGAVKASTSIRKVS